MGLHRPLCVLFTLALISHSRGQMMRKMTLEDMEQMTSRIMSMDFGPKVNMSRARIVDGKLLTVKNLIQYSTTVKTGRESCVIVTVVDGLTGKTISTQRRCDMKAQIDETEQFISNLITGCDQIHRNDGDNSEFRATIKLLNMVLQQYRTAGNILVFDKNIFRFNIFSAYGKIIRQLLEEMRTRYDRNNQRYYVDNIEFIISIREVVELLENHNESPDEYSSVKGIVTSIMDAYYKNHPLDKFKNDLEKLSNDRLKIIILPLIQIVTDPPPTKNVETPASHQGPVITDSFESALRQLIIDLEGIGRANQRYEVQLLQFFNEVLKNYLANLYVLPKFEFPANFKFDFSSEAHTDIFNKFLLLLQQQYNEQHDNKETEKCFRITQIIDLLLKFSKLLPDKSKNDYKIVANVSVEIVWGGKPGISTDNFDQLTRILELLVKLAQTRRTTKAPEDGSKKLFDFIVKILEALRNPEGSSEELGESEIPQIDGYKNLIEEVRRIVERLKSKSPRKEEDEFLAKVKTIVSHLKDIQRDVCKPKCTSNGYEKLLAILIIIQKDYRKNKMLRIYTIEELQLYNVYLEYADIFYQLIKAMEHQYIKQKQWNEVTKLIWIFQIQKMLTDVERDLKRDAEIANIKDILIKIMKDIYDRKRMEENYIAELMKLKGENAILTKLIIRLITMINNMPQQILPPRTNEDYFEKEIRLLISLLTKIHEEGKSDKGFKDTMFLLQFVLMKYQTNKTLPGFKLEELKFDTVHMDYQEVVDKLIQLLQKKYVEQHQNDELMKLIYVSKVRELITELNVVSEADEGTGFRTKIKNILGKIMFDLYTHGKLMKDYEKMLDELKDQSPRHKDLIIEIIKYLKTCPKDKGVDSKKDDKGSPVTIILIIIDNLKQMKDRADNNFSDLMALLEKIIKAINDNNKKLPSLENLHLQLDIYLRSGLYDDVLTKLINELLSRYSTEKKLKDVSVLVKIGFLLDYVTQLRRIHTRLGSDVGYQALLESLITMIDDLCKNREFTKDYMKDWGAFWVTNVEYKSTILLVIEILRQGCGPCDFTPQVTTTTTTPRPVDSGEVSIETDAFEKLIRDVRELVYRLRHEKGQPDNGYLTLNQWLEKIEKLYYANNKSIPRYGLNEVHLYEPVKGYDEAINKLIENLMRQYKVQAEEDEAKKLKCVLELRVYLVKMSQINDGRERQQLTDLLINIIRRLWNGKKLKEEFIHKLQRFTIGDMNKGLIMQLIVYFRTLPAVYWVVPVVRDDFEEALRRYLAMLKMIHDKGGSPEIYKAQVKGIEMLLKIYKDHNKTLPSGLRPKFSNMYEVTLQYSDVWRQMIQALIAQYRRQNQMEEIRRYEFVLQMQWFLRQIIFVKGQVNTDTFKQIIELILQIFSDFHGGVMHKNYVNSLLQFIRYNALRTIVPNVMYYMTNYDNNFTWINGQPQQQYMLKTLRQQLTVRYTSKVIIRQVYTVWNGNLACGNGCNNYY